MNPKKNLRAVSLSTAGRPGPRQWIVKNKFPERFPSVIYSAGGKGKTFLGIHLGLTVADPSQDQWLGSEATTGPVIYVDFEMDHDEVLTRAYDVAAGMGRDDLPEDFWYMGCVESTPDEAFAAVHEECREHDVKLVIVDSFGMAMDGDSTNASEVRKFYRQYLNPLRSLGVTPVILDHQAKSQVGENYGDKEEYGSVYKRNNNRSSFQLNGEWTDNVFKGKLTHKKTNMGPQLDPIPVSFEFEHERVTIQRDDTLTFEASTQDKVLDAIRTNGPSTNTELAYKLKMNIASVRNRTGELRKAEKIEDSGDKRDKEKVWQIHSSIHNIPTRESVNRESDSNDILLGDEAA